MCGLIGELNINQKELDEKTFRQSIDLLKSRGPDSQGYYRYKNIFQLGFRRLSIIDLEKRSDQPMQDIEGKVILVFNGEIYNFKKIRKELINKKIEFVTQSDTEVILNLYKDQGVDGLKNLRGMFSIVICDLNQKKIIFFRDPYGIKPLYFFQNDEIFLFSSTVKSLLNFKQIKKEINKESLNFFYFFGAVKENSTIIKDIKTFEPGFVYELDFSNNLSRKKYLDIEDEFKSVITEEIDLKENFEKNLEKHMQSDVPIALMLSGGMDSSLLLKTLKNTKKNIHPFTLGFQSFEGKKNDEFKISKKYCDQLNIKLNKICLLDEEILENLDQFFHHMDQPTYDGLNTFLITKYINQNHFKVALSGLGADEIFNGYNTLSRLKFLNSLRLFYNNFLFRKLIKFLGFIFNQNKLIKFFELLSNYNSPYQIYLLLRSKKNSLHKVENEYIDKILMDNKKLNNFNFYDLVSLLESKIYMKNQLLRDTDWASMANSIEVRVPFVDYDFLKNFKNSNYKFFKKKNLFEKIFNLPKFITRKKKTGFDVPFKQIVDIYNKKYKTNYENWSDICINEYFNSIK